MSQLEIVELLCNNPDEWIKVEDVQKALNKSKPAVSKSIRSMITYGELEVKFETGEGKKRGRGYTRYIRYIKLNKDFYKQYMIEKGRLV